MLKDKVIIVTGGSSGIGRASALHFASCGAKVVIASRNEAQGAEVQKEIEAEGAEALFVRTDVSVEQDVKNMVTQTLDRFGKLDGALNNAGIEQHHKTIQDLDKDQWQKVIDIDLTGVFLCMKYEIIAMKELGGAIVNVSSANGQMAQPASGEYVAAKHGVVGLTRAASTEARSSGVRVNAILPGLIMTPLVKDRMLDSPAMAGILDLILDRHSVGRFGVPEDIAYAAKWLLSDESTFVNGLMMNVDGGMTAR